jgi:uncharacterized protein YjbI with pentapeptide repeats
MPDNMRAKPGAQRRRPNSSKGENSNPAPSVAATKRSLWNRIFWPLSAVLALVLIAFGVIWSQLNVIRQQQLTENAQVSDEFARAAGLLGSQSLDVRLAGLYMLQHLMRDSGSYEPIIVAVISAYVRDRALQPASQHNHETDILAAVKILSGLAGQIRARIDLRGANLAKTNLNLINLDHADLISAQLFDAELFGAHLSAAELYGAQLTGTDLRIAQLIGTDLRRVHLDSAKLRHAHLNKANLGGADLAGANMTGATLTSANLAGANMTGATLTSANLAGANMTGATLTGARLIGANLVKATVSYANLHGADLSHADLRQVDLRTTTGLTSNHLKCARVNRLTRLPAGVVVPSCAVAQRGCTMAPPEVHPELWCRIMTFHAVGVDMLAR